MYAGVCILDNPYHIDGIYDYEIPVELGDSVTPGRLVTVPFGVRNHVRLALVTELREQSAYREMKFIKSVIDSSEKATAMYWIYFVAVALIIAVVAGIASTFIFYQRRD